MSENRELIESLTAAPAQTFCPGLMDLLGEERVDNADESGADNANLSGYGGSNYDDNEDDLSLDLSTKSSNSSSSSMSSVGPASSSFEDFLKTSDDNLILAHGREVLHARHQEVRSKHRAESKPSSQVGAKKEREVKRRRSRRPGRPTKRGSDEDRAQNEGPQSPLIEAKTKRSVT